MQNIIRAVSHLESLDKKKVLIGECKWTEGEYDDRLFADLKERASLCPFIKGREVVYVLFLKGIICRLNSFATKKNPPKGVYLSDFICTFAMSFQSFIAFILHH